MWVPLAADLEPLSGQLVILAFGAYEQAVQSWVEVLDCPLLGSSCSFSQPNGI